MVKQINKRIKKVNVPHTIVNEDIDNNKNLKDNTMTTEQLERAEGLVKNINKPKVKVIKKEKGLIERTESEKVVLTEDNRQVLND